VICSSIETNTYHQTVLASTPPPGTWLLSKSIPNIVEHGAIVTITTTFTNNAADDAVVWSGSDDQYIPTGTITNGVPASGCIPSAGLNAYYVCKHPTGNSFNTYSNGGLRMLMLPTGTTVCTLRARVCGNAGVVLPISSTYTIMNHNDLTQSQILTAGAPTTIQNAQPSLTFIATTYPSGGNERTYHFNLTSTSVPTDPLTYTLTSNCPANTQIQPHCTTANSWECSQVSPAQSGTLTPGATDSTSLDMLICGSGTGQLTFTATYSDDEGSTRTATVTIDATHGFIQVKPATAAIKLRGEQVVLQQPIS